MNHKIYFYNHGLIDIDAVKTMGVSVKDEGAIGYFGTGLKFAVATILRNGGTVTVYRGERAHKFGTVKTDIRGQSFDLVTLDGERIGFTTMMGRDWQPWMAYRELACNAFDEGGSVSSMPTSPSADGTLIVADDPEIAECHRIRRTFLIEPGEIPQHESDDCQAFISSTGTEDIFYRGVRVTRNPTRSLFRYNVLSKVDLTEDRTAMYRFHVADPVARMYLRCTDKSVLRDVLSAQKGWMEYDLDWMTCGCSPGATWLEAVAELGRDGVLMNRAIERAYEKATKKSPSLPSAGIELRPEQQAMLNRAVALLERAGYPVSGKKIIVTHQLAGGIIGRAANEMIYLSVDAFRSGDSTLAGTILEEWLHLTKGFDDHSRLMQNWLLDSLIEQINRADYVTQEQAA